MHWSHALSRSHTQPILMPRTPPWGREAARCDPARGGGVPRPRARWGVASRPVLTVLASLVKSWPANWTTSPTRRMGQNGAVSGWKRQVFTSLAVRLGRRFPLRGGEWGRRGGDSEAHTLPGASSEGRSAHGQAGTQGHLLPRPSWHSSFSASPSPPAQLGLCVSASEASRSQVPSGRREVPADATQPARRARTGVRHTLGAGREAGTHFWKLKSGKRMLFLMKMVKFSASIMMGLQDTSLQPLGGWAGDTAGTAWGPHKPRQTRRRSGCGELGSAPLHRVHLRGAPALDLAGAQLRAVVDAAAGEDAWGGDTRGHVPGWPLPWPPPPPAPRGRPMPGTPVRPLCLPHPVSRAHHECHPSRKPLGHSWHMRHCRPGLLHVLSLLTCSQCPRHLCNPCTSDRAAQGPPTPEASGVRHLYGLGQNRTEQSRPRGWPSPGPTVPGPHSPPLGKRPGPHWLSFTQRNFSSLCGTQGTGCRR